MLAQPNRPIFIKKAKEIGLHWPINAGPIVQVKQLKRPRICLIVPGAWEFLSIPVPDLKQNGDDGGKQAAEKDKEARILEMGDSLSNVQTPSRLLPT